MLFTTVQLSNVFLSLYKEATKGSKDHFYLSIDTLFLLFRFTDCQTTVQEILH